MAIVGGTDFTGGDIGDPITVVTEPFFQAKLGAQAVLYADVDGVQQGALMPSGGSGSLSRTSMDGLTTYGFTWKVKFLSSTATTAFYPMLTLRNGSDPRADVGLRNASGSRHNAARNNFTYFGNDTGHLLVADEINSYDVLVEEGDMTVRVWYGADTSGAPDLTWGPVTIPGDIDNWMVGPGANTGVGAVIFDFWMSDGEDAPPTPGALDFLSNVYAEQTELVLVGKTTGAEEVTLDIDGRLVVVEPDEAGYFRAHVDELDADTAYPWDLLVDGVSRRTGETKTLPNLLDGLTILWGSCFDAPGSAFFDLAAARNPDMIVNLGDWGYQYITGGPNGNTSPTDVASCRAHREGVLAAAAPQALFTKYPTSYTYSDCDGAGSNADGTTGGHATGAVQAAYRQQFAHPALPLEDCGARSWVVGRVRFIQTDETALASVRDATDDENKTKLGATQEAWFFDQIDQAAAAGQAVVWFGDGPWIEPAGAGSATYNSWAKYNTARTRIGAYAEASGVPLARPHGDTHTVFADDGSNNDWGGFPTASAAPFHTTGQPFGYPTSEGSWPTSTTNSSRQYGIAEFADDGETITLTLKGYSSTNAAPIEVERYEMVIDLTPGAPPAADYALIEWDGESEVTLEALEWDGEDEVALAVVNEP